MLRRNAFGAVLSAYYINMVIPDTDGSTVGTVGSIIGHIKTMQIAGDRSKIATKITLMRCSTVCCA